MCKSYDELEYQYAIECKNRAESRAIEYYQKGDTLAHRVYKERVAYWRRQIDHLLEVCEV